LAYIEQDFVCTILLYSILVLYFCYVCLYNINYVYSIFASSATWRRERALSKITALITEGFGSGVTERVI
jgi:hypothetical protein